MSDDDTTGEGSSFWSDPAIKKAAEGGGFFKFNDIGDTISGVIKTLGKKTFNAGTKDEQTAIEVEFDDERKVTFGQVKMLQQLYAMRPEAGAKLTVTLAQVEKRGAKTLKSFKGEVVHANGEVERFDQTA